MAAFECGTSLAQRVVMADTVPLVALREELFSMGVIYAEVSGLPEDRCSISGWTVLARVGRDDGAVGVRVTLERDDPRSRVKRIEALLPLSSSVSASALLVRLQAWMTTARWEESFSPVNTGEQPSETEQRVEAAARRWKLSKRESEVLSLLVKGLANKEMASELSLSPKTVEQHVSTLLRKSGIEQRNKLIVEVHSISVGWGSGR